MSSVSYPDLANQSLSRDLAVWRDVLVIPWGDNPPKGAARAAGLFDKDGAYIEAGTCSRWGGDALTIRPDYRQAGEVETLPGRWLFGGLLYGHFGHFLCESTGRIWALDHLDQPVDGILWFPKVELSHPAKLVKHYHPFFAALGQAGLRLACPQKPVRVEEMLIPEQGFGIGMAAAGRPEYRAFMRKNLGAGIAPRGRAKLYVSRAGLPSKRGSLLLEERIEALMEAAGYRIFRPEEHSIERQIARYKAARLIVGPDGSALHLAAMVATPDTKVAIINRGPSQNIEDYARQFHHFAGIKVQQIEAILAYWFEEGRRVVKRETHALLDFAATSQALMAGGFLKGPVWEQPSEAEIASAIAEREAKSEARLQRYEMGEDAS